MADSRWAYTKRLKEGVDNGEQPAPRVGAVPTQAQVDEIVSLVDEREQKPKAS
jgi:hypothetical protein